MGLLDAIGSVVNTVVQVVDTVATVTTSATSGIIDGVQGKIADGKDNSEQQKIAKEMGNYKMIALLKEEDEFVKEEEKAEKEKETDKETDKRNKTQIEKDVNTFHQQASLSSEDLVNNMTKTNIISQAEVTNFNQFVENLLNDTKDNTTLAESMKKFNSKLTEIETALKKYKSEYVENKDKEDVFSLDTKKDKYDKNNKIKTYNIFNLDKEETQKTFIA